MAEVQGTAESPLRFSLLGPMQVHRGDTPLSLGRLQQRVVLALLLLRRGRPYAKGQMIDEIWGAEPPAYAENLLQKHVSLLRQLLEPEYRASRTRILGWTDAGYVLSVPADALDLLRFEAYLRKARSARTSGDPGGAATMLDAGLRLWRGALCDGLHSRVLDAERDRLDELRLDAMESQIEVDLDLGRERDVSELRRLVRDHPGRERLRESLMLALHRAGRTGEALAAYRDTRRHLRDELGVDPGDRTQRLHERILAGDPGLMTAAESAVRLGSSDDSTVTRTDDRAAETADRQSSTASGRADVPAQLPHPVPHFTGRRVQLRQLNDVLAGGVSAPRRGSSIVALAGAAGVGKTALAIAWAHDVKHEFPNGQLYVNLRGFDPTSPPMEPAEAVRGFLDALGVSAQRLPVTVDGQCAFFRSLLAERRMLLVLDNARDSDQVRPLLPGSADCVVLVTSRNDLTGLVASDGAVPIVLDVLSDGEAGAYLSERLGSVRIEREPVAAAEIVTLCARLPLALVLVAARAATHPNFSLHTLAAELRESGGLLDAFDSGGDGEGTNVRRVFSWSQSGLSTQAARLFGLLAVHPGPQIGVAEAGVLAEQPPGRTRRILAELSRAHLVEEVAPTRFAFHDLLRAYAAELVEETEDRATRDAAFGRLLDFYAHTALHADRLLNPLRWPDLWLVTTPVVAPEQLHDADAALHWFRTELPVLMGVLDQAYRRQIDVPTIQLAWALETYLNRTAHWHDLEQSQRATLTAARRLGDRRAEAHAERALAGAYTWRGEFATAAEHFTAALRLFADLDDVAGQARTHRSLGWAFERQGSFREALEQTERALDLHRELGYEAGLADALNAVGWFRAQLGDPAAALHLCEEALLLDQRIGHLEGEACTWDSLGFIHDALGDLERATTCYRRSVERFIEINDTYQEAATQVCLGDVYHRAGREADAYAAWARADTAYSELGLDTPADVSARLAQRGELGGAA